MASPLGAARVWNLGGSGEKLGYLAWIWAHAPGIRQILATMKRQATRAALSPTPESQMPDFAIHDHLYNTKSRGRCNRPHTRMILM